MNRHMRRAAARDLEPRDWIREFASIAEKLNPYLAQLGELQTQLGGVEQLLREAQEENSALRAALLEQRAVYLRLFARGMGVSLDSVISMETEFRHAVKNPDSETNSSANDTCARAES